MTDLDNDANPARRLVAAHQVQGTEVFNTALERLGKVEDIMIDQATGRIAYAILSFGGFLGIGDHHYPLPWEKLHFDTEMGGYIVDISRDVLEHAPSYTGARRADWNDPAWIQAIQDVHRTGG